MSPNASPISVHEAAYRVVKGKRSGREGGLWVYLDAALLVRAGLPPGLEASAIAIRRYPWHDAKRPHRGSVVLHLSFDGPTPHGPARVEAEGDLVPRVQVGQAEAEPE